MLIQNTAAFSVLPARLALSRNARVHIQAHTHAPSCARSRRGICLRAQQEGGGDAPEGSLVDKVAAKGLWQGGVYMLHASFIFKPGFFRRQPLGLPYEVAACVRVVRCTYLVHVYVFASSLYL